MWTIFKVSVEFVTMLLLGFFKIYFLVILAWGMWDLSSLTRDWTLTPCIKGKVFFFLVGGYLLYNIVVGFCHTLTWISHGFTCIPIPIPPPTSLSARSLWVFPVHQARALVSCIRPGLVICFTVDNTHVSMLFSWNIPPSPSPTESKSLFYTSVSLFLFYI